MSEPNATPLSLEGLDYLSPQALLAAIVDSSDDAIVSKNLDGVVTSWNRGAERIFGYTAAEMVGEHITRIIPAERQSEEPAILARLRAGERVDHFETVRVRKDGSTVDVSLTISPVRRADGRIIGASKIARDITQHKLAIRKLQEANENLARADRMKVEFISTLSHELRTPLTSIAGWVQLLKEDPQPEDLKQGLEVIDRNIRVQTQLINDLLDMSRIETGKMTLDLQRLDASLAVQAAIDSVIPAADAKGVRLTSAFGSVNGIVMGDRNRMQQIVWNLLTNAVKFTPRGGRVHVTIQRVNSHVEIAVADTGAGIAPEFLGRIFDRFTQADSSISRKYSGLGIGLSIAKYLTELHGGSITAKSPGLGQGATFCMNLPLLAIDSVADGNDAERRASEVDADLPEDDLKGIAVLVVDDDPDSAAVIARTLERKGATVRVCHTMEDGLQALESAIPDILLSHIGMPSHDGYEFISRVRQMPQGKRLPAVALTALARAEDRTRSLRAGFQLHISKPVDAPELVAAIRNLADLRNS